MIGLVIGLLFFAAIVFTYANGSKVDRDRYYQLEHKRRFGGKKLPPAELEEWERLARKFKW